MMFNRNEANWDRVARVALGVVFLAVGLTVVDGTLVVGEVHERDKAFEIYDDAMEAGHGAFLLDEERADVFQASVGTHAQADIAMTVLTQVIGRRPAEHRLLVDAGGIALSKDRSTQPTTDLGFGLVLDLHGQPRFGRSVVAQAYQEHGVVALDPALPFPDLPVGTPLRIAPNHTCMTAAAHDRYWVVDGSDQVVAEWPRVNGW